MIKIILGLIILLIPFLLTLKFQDRKKGFFSILAFFIFFHLITALITQFFGIFNYPIILSINILSGLIIILKTDFKELKEKIAFKKIKIDFILIFVLIVVFIELFSVHFNYTGKISDIKNPYENLKEVKNMKYVYPYFSDEWVAVSLIKYSTETGKLPFVNPLWKNSYFPNLEFAFHSFLSEFFLILNLNPLTSYVFFAIIFGLLICFLVYFLLRFNKVGRFASAIAALSIPLIVNSGTFPGIWYLIPLIIGLICMLLTFIFISINDKKMIFLSSFLTLIFYPPLFILLIFSIIPYFLFYDKKYAKNFFLFFFICFLAILFLIFNLEKNANSFNFIISKIFYLFVIYLIQDYSIWKIIPLFSIIFAILGLIKFRKKIWIFLPIFVGLAFWSLYSVILVRFIIDYDRLVFATSVLIIIVSGFGMDFLVNQSEKFFNKKTIRILEAIILVLFLIYAFNYTSHDKWENIKFYGNGKVFNPTSPATVFLQEKDLELFQNITEKVFIAPPWKGLVIGVATGNYPLESKGSTITNQFFTYNKFMELNCKEKKQTALDYDISYAYSENFSCDSFRRIGKSKELYLYEFEK